MGHARMIWSDRYYNNERQIHHNADELQKQELEPLHSNNMGIEKQDY